MRAATLFDWADAVARLRRSERAKTVALGLMRWHTGLKIGTVMRPSIELLSERLSMDPRIVRLGLADLHKAGLIDRKRRGNGPSETVLTIPGDGDRHDQSDRGDQTDHHDHDQADRDDHTEGIVAITDHQDQADRDDHTDRIVAIPLSRSDLGEKNQNPPISGIDLTINPPGARETLQTPETQRSISSTGTQSRDESGTAASGVRDAMAKDSTPGSVASSQSSSRPAPTARGATGGVSSQSSRPTAAEIAFGADLVRSTWTRPADRYLSLGEERAVSALHKAIGDRDIERAETAWGRVELARLGAHIATMVMPAVMTARADIVAALNGNLPPPPMTDQERRERMARLLAATAEKHGSVAPPPAPAPAELSPEARKSLSEIAGVREPLSGSALDAHRAEVRARAVALHGEEAVAEIERRQSTLRARSAAEIEAARGTTRSQVIS